MTDEALRELAKELALTRITLEILRTWLDTVSPGYENRHRMVFQSMWNNVGELTTEECYKMLTR